MKKIQKIKKTANLRFEAWPEELKKNRKIKKIKALIFYFFSIFLFFWIIFIKNTGNN